MVLVLGDINLDIIVNLREEINFNTDSESDIHFKGGGSAANFSYWLDYLNHQVRFVAKTGDDFIVSYLKNQFQNTKIDFINLLSKDKNTGRIVILLSETGDRTMVTDRGANVDFSPEDITNDYFKGVEHLHLGGYSFFGGKNMEETALKIIKKAKENNVKISFDPSSYSGLKNYAPPKKF
ncbi:MAG: carbohydrate kinase family protein [Halanaerobiales bacterium]|nr:carbohydrate kinase family protein [Halanaerobiales bacterium]